MVRSVNIGLGPTTAIAEGKQYQSSRQRETCELYICDPSISMPVNLIMAWLRARAFVFLETFPERFCDITLHCLHFMKLLELPGCAYHDMKS